MTLTGGSHPQNNLSSSTTADKGNQRGNGSQRQMSGLRFAPEYTAPECKQIGLHLQSA